jgi:hypothetical protein
MSQTFRRHAQWLAPALLLLAGSARAQVKEPAELLPAETLAYIELRHPERLARELAALGKGSVLDNLPAALAKFRARLADGDSLGWRTENVAMLGTLLAPEMFSEAGRLQGALLALTGISKAGPEYVAVILSGSSNAPTLYMRAYLAADSSIRGRGEVEGVGLYRARRRNWRKTEKYYPKEKATDKGERVAPPAPVYEDDGPTFALLPGGVVFGTEASVKEVIRRAKGKGSTPSLTSVRAYKESARLRQQPGLFAYADLAALSGQMDQMFKDDTSRDARDWNAFKKAVKPEAFRSAAISLSLSGGELGLHAHVRLDPKQSSPLLDLLPDRQADTSLLRFVPQTTALALGTSLPDGAARWQKLLDLLDAAVKPGLRKGELLPSQMAAEYEGKLTLKLGRDVFGKIGALALVFDVSEALPEGAERLPMLLMQGTDLEAARFLEEKVVPRLAVWAADSAEAITPRRDKEDGVSEFSLGRSRLGKVLFCARKGKVVVLGQHRRSVANAVRGEGVLGDRQVATAVKALDAPLFGVASVGQALVPLLRELETPSFREMKRYGIKDKGFPKDKGFEPPAPRPRPVPFEKYVKDLSKVVAPMTPGVISLTRKTDLLTLEFRQPELRTYAAPVINLWIDSALARAARVEQEYQRMRDLERKRFQESFPPKEKAVDKGRKD